ATAPVAAFCSIVVPQAATPSARTPRLNRAIVRFIMLSNGGKYGSAETRPEHGRFPTTSTLSRAAHGGVLSQRGENNISAKRNHDDVVTDDRRVTSMFMNTTT